MHIGFLKETAKNENRVAVTPETVKKIKALSLDVIIQKGAGENAGFSDDDYKQAGASIVDDKNAVVAKSDVICSVQLVDNLKGLANKTLVGMFSPFHTKKKLEGYSKDGARLIAMEFMPRITRAQNMDVLSSQSNLAGYRAVIDACAEFNRAMPMMMTAAGTIVPAKVLVLGAGVAGLQAIATAKRLGASVSAFDVRKAAAEQVQSLGAKFIAVESDEDAETAGGYAKETSEEYKKRQADLIHETLKKMDIVISTALIPGKPAPILITKEMLKDMPRGSVIVDLAAPNGGNCESTTPDEIVEVGGVKIIGYTNFASRIARDASALYARNVFNFLSYIIDEESKQLKWSNDDEIISSVMLSEGGELIHNSMK
jgi:NAD(P) transhydrogenase subunit alpha